MLDGYVGVHAFAATGAPTPASIANPLYAVASTDPFDALLCDASSRTGIVVTGSYPNAAGHSELTSRTRSRAT